MVVVMAMRWSVAFVAVFDCCGRQGREGGCSRVGGTTEMC